MTKSASSYYSRHSSGKLLYYDIKTVILIPVTLCFFQTVTPTQLNESLKQIFEAVHTRSFYLNCIDKSELLPPSGALRGNPALG